MHLRNDNKVQIPAIVLNERDLQWSEACTLLRPRLTRQALTACGGVLFNAALKKDQSLLLNIQPNYVNGQRCHHYDMPLPENSMARLSGDITPGGEMAILFDISALKEDAPILRLCCITLASLLTKSGLDPRHSIRKISQQGLKEVGAFENAPSNIGLLAALDTD